MKTIWSRQSGEALHYDTVDAREILERSPDLYTDVDPNPPAEGDTFLAPRNVTDVEDEFRREPVGTNPVEHPIERSQPIIRNATGAPREAMDGARKPAEQAAPVRRRETARGFRRSR